MTVDVGILGIRTTATSTRDQGTFLLWFSKDTVFRPKKLFLKDPDIHITHHPQKFKPMPKAVRMPPAK
jgi:hypothetical protein